MLYRRMRKGITPVIAIVLLLMMTVAAAGAAYTWFSQMQSRLQAEATAGLNTELSVKDLQCKSKDAGTDPNTVKLALKNSGSTQIDLSNVDVFVRGSDGHLNATFSDLDWSGSSDCEAGACAFSDPGGFAEVSIDMTNADSGSKFLVNGRFYKVEVDFSLSDYTLDAGGCLGE